jgi:uncharacterized protein YpmB
MNSFLLKLRLKDAHALLAKTTNQDAIDAINLSIKHLEDAIWEVEMIEFEERVGFKSMEQNAGVWDER